MLQRIDCTIFLGLEFRNFSLTNVDGLRHEEEKTSVLICCPLYRHVTEQWVNKMGRLRW